MFYNGFFDKAGMLCPSAKQLIIEVINFAFHNDKVHL